MKPVPTVLRNGDGSGSGDGYGDGNGEAEGTPNLPTTNLPAKIAWLRLSGKLFMDMIILLFKLGFCLSRTL